MTLAVVVLSVFGISKAFAEAEPSHPQYEVAFAAEGDDASGDSATSRGTHNETADAGTQSNPLTTDAGTTPPNRNESRWKQWLRERRENVINDGPKLVLILVLMVVLGWLARPLARRIVTLVVRNASDSPDREKRANTLVSVFLNVVSIAIIVGGGLTILDILGIPIAPLLGGAAVAGLAVAFGAQNLMRDYFNGFMVLLENQYGINDVVQINDVSGQVERITLRVTVLRDLAGTVHYMPHGQITKVSNMSQGWSRAVLDIGVAYKEDVDRVMKVLVELAKDLRQDPVLGPDILDDPQMLGVDAFGDSAVVIKMLLKTRPSRQWDVKRELMRRIKVRFDEQGIEIPFPHRMLLLPADVEESLRAALNVDSDAPDTKARDRDSRQKKESS